MTGRLQRSARGIREILVRPDEESKAGDQLGTGEVFEKEVQRGPGVRFLRQLLLCDGFSEIATCPPPDESLQFPDNRLGLDLQDSRARPATTVRSLAAST